MANSIVHPLRAPAGAPVPILRRVARERKPSSGDDTAMAATGTESPTTAHVR